MDTPDSSTISDPDEDLNPVPEAPELTTTFAHTASIPRIPTPPSPTLVQQTGQIFTLPPQAPPPPSVAMTTKPNELHIATPEHFDGTYSKTTPWLSTILFYLEVNDTVYNTSAKKITFVLSYMTKGAAQTWAATFRQKAITGATISMGTFDNFVKEFRATFEHHDIVGNTISWLTHKRMTSKNNGTFEPPLTTYIDTFQNHIAQSGITDHNVLIRFFSAGIPSGPMKSIYSMETVPTTTDDWCKKALTFQMHYEQTREVEQRRRNPAGTYCPFATTPATPAKDPNAMEVDAIKVAKLSKEERERCMKEGLYLRTHGLELPHLLSGETSQRQKGRGSPDPPQIFQQRSNHRKGGCRHLQGFLEREEPLMHSSPPITVASVLVSGIKDM